MPRSSIQTGSFPCHRPSPSQDANAMRQWSLRLHTPKRPQSQSILSYLTSICTYKSDVLQPMRRFSHQRRFCCIVNLCMTSDLWAFWAALFDGLLFCVRNMLFVNRLGPSLRCSCQLLGFLPHHKDKVHPGKLTAGT